jgi:hypothetical protein
MRRIIEGGLDLGKPLPSAHSAMQRRCNVDATEMQRSDLEPSFSEQPRGAMQRFATFRNVYKPKYLNIANAGLRGIFFAVISNVSLERVGAIDEIQNSDEPFLDRQLTSDYKRNRLRL